VLTVIDVDSRVVLNYVFKNSIKQNDVIWLMSSIVGNEKTQGISIRNDNGFQFLANKVRIYLNEIGSNQEFTHIATPEENSYIEAFHSIMARELVSHYEFDSFDHAEVKMAQWMHFFNQVRRHGKIKHQTPAQKLANY
jgi:putative transposase